MPITVVPVGGYITGTVAVAAGAKTEIAANFAKLLLVLPNPATKVAGATPDYDAIPVAVCVNLRSEIAAMALTVSAAP